VISLELARRLREAGLRWTPTSGDRFAVAQSEMANDVFTVSEMVVDLHELSDGTVIGFNGTVEWALDSVALERTIWLPSEGQLRERLGNTFRRLEPSDGRWRVTTSVLGRDSVHEHEDAAEAYGLALLELITAATR
jgi:hypothetical protein